MNKTSGKFPKTDEEVIFFWNLILRVLKQLGPQRLEIWEFEDVVQKAIHMDSTKGWCPKATYKQFPRLIVYLARTALPVLDILYLHQKLHIELESYDKNELEKREKIRIETNRKGLVVEWKKAEECGEEIKSDNDEEVDMQRATFTLNDEQAMMEYVLQKTQRSANYGIKISRMATETAWQEFAGKDVKKRTGKSFENHFRKVLKPNLYSMEYLKPEERLFIGKMMEVKISQEAHKFFQNQYNFEIELKDGKVFAYKLC